MKTAIVWFRKSIRLHDNLALARAIRSNNVESILPILILDENIIGNKNRIFAKNRLKFLTECIKDLDGQLQTKYGSKLLLLKGKPAEIFQNLISNEKLGITEAYIDYCSEPYGRKISEELERSYAKSISRFEVVKTGNTILDIEKIVHSPDYKNPKSMRDIEKLFLKILGKKDDGFYNVEEPIPEPREIKPLPSIKDNLNYFQIELDEFVKEIETELGISMNLVDCYFSGGETEALKRLKLRVSNEKQFVRNFRKPKTISTNMNKNPREPQTTGLSPYISTGCLSIRVLWNECQKIYLNSEHTMPPESLHGQLLFREMFYLLSRSVENWDSDTENIMCKKIDWGEYDKEKVEAWESGKTGFPYIDAMMRQLDKTGWMHHLGRHAVSCFLTRGQLWQNWTYGRDIFERKLLDSDWALNNGNWLWLSGVAPFSMPYFRLYNPCPDARSSLNVETKEAKFIKYWIPELKNFPVKYILEPHLAPLSIQKKSNCIIGEDYPQPIVDRKESAKINLAKFKRSLSN